MIYTYTKTYKATEITCGDMVEKLVESNGGIHCFEAPMFIEEEGEAPIPICTNWAWIRAQRANHKLILLDYAGEKFCLREQDAK